MRRLLALACLASLVGCLAPPAGQRPTTTAADRTTTDTFTAFDTDGPDTFDAFDTDGPDTFDGTTDTAGGTPTEPIYVEGATQLVFVVDITGSWGEAGFNMVRLALRDALLGLIERRPRALQVGLVVFTGRYAWEYTPLTRLDASSAPDLREGWIKLNIASKAGANADPHDGVPCVLNSGPQMNDFSSPPGGCYPDMPREYRDEPGTDASTGLSLVTQMFTDAEHRAGNRRIIVITDGQPNALGSGSGQARQAAGFVETRWRQWTGPVPRLPADIRAAASTEADLLYEVLGADISAIGYIVNDPILPGMARGAGEAAVANSPEQLRQLVIATLADTIAQ